MEKWEHATVSTIERLQAILKTTGKFKGPLSDYSRIKLLELAHRIVECQDRTKSATEYWGTFTNTVRILVASITMRNAEEYFDEGNGA